MLVHKNMSVKRRLDYLNTVELPFWESIDCMPIKIIILFFLRKTPELLVVYGINNHTACRPKSRAEVAYGTLTLLLPYL